MFEQNRKGRLTQIFRITHIDNLPFILRHGLYAPNSDVKDPDFRTIGYPTLIDYRKERKVPIAPGGVLADYVPFYFWYRSPMLYVIYRGNDPEVIQTPQSEVVYLVSAIEALIQNNCQFVFTDRHAKLEYAKFYNNPGDVRDKLQWEWIKSDDWGRQFGPERKEMKQAECLVFNHVPREAITGIAVRDEVALNKVQDYLHESELKIITKIKPGFYY